MHMRLILFLGLALAFASYSNSADPSRSLEEQKSKLLERIIATEDDRLRERLVTIYEALETNQPAPTLHIKAAEGGAKTAIEAFHSFEVLRNESNLPDCDSDFFDSCWSAYVYEDGSKYDGEWKNDKPHGIGNWRGVEFNYHGGLQENGMDGFGILVRKDGDIEFGIRKSGEPHYFTLQNNQGADLYSCVNPSNDEKNCDLITIQSELPNCKYGDFYDACIGWWHFPEDKLVYFGEWQQDTAEGWGQRIYYEDSPSDWLLLEEAIVVDGKQNGPIALYHYKGDQKGAKFDGFVKNGKFDGEGTYTIAGESTELDCKDNETIDKCRIISPNEIVASGDSQEDQPIGNQEKPTKPKKRFFEAIGMVLKAVGEYGSEQNARAAEQNRAYNERRNNSQSNQQVQKSQTMNFCNLVRTDRGRTTEGLSLNRGSNVPGNTEPTICTYECSDGSIKQTTAGYGCPSRP